MSNRLLTYLPPYERESIIFQEIMKAEEIELDELDEQIKDLEQQLNPDTATWGLAIYEKELGLPIEPNIDIRVRRSLVKAKLLMQPPTSKVKVESILKSFVESAEIEEIFNEYRFNITLKTIDTVGDKIQYVYRVIEEFKPAHLGYMLIICYLYIPEIFLELKKYFSERLKIAGLEDVNENEHITTLGKSYKNKASYIFNKWFSLFIPTTSEERITGNQGKSYKSKIIYLFDKWDSFSIPTVSESNIIQATGKNYNEEFKYQLNSYTSSRLQSCSENIYTKEGII